MSSVFHLPAQAKPGIIIVVIEAQDHSMVLVARINKLKDLIVAIQTEFETAVNTGKPFYIKKEILQRLRLAMNELEQLMPGARDKDL